MLGQDVKAGGPDHTYVVHRPQGPTRQMADGRPAVAERRSPGTDRWRSTPRRADCVALSAGATAGWAATDRHSVKSTGRSGGRADGVLWERCHKSTTTRRVQPQTQVNMARHLRL